MAITTSIKRLLYPLYIYPRILPGKKNKLHKVFDSYLEKKQGSKVNPVPLRIFSNLDEDGIILRLLASINIRTGYFIDVGSNDCINSNCANLVFNFDWNGVFIDANEKLLITGRKVYTFFGKGKDLKFVHCFLSPETINNVIGENVTKKEIDFMSVDIDGNDYEIWKALKVVKPKIVVIENKIEYGDYDIVVPTVNPFLPSEYGASIVSFTKLAVEKGYTLVAVNNAGFNAFYMRNDCFLLSGLPALRVDEVLRDEQIKKCFYSPGIMSALQYRLLNS